MLIIFCCTISAQIFIVEIKVLSPNPNKQTMCVNVNLDD